jgi:hypothetical protein
MKKPLEPEITKASSKRGRPHAKGLKPLWMLLRISHVLKEYDDARLQGKHLAAIRTTIDAIRNRFPKMRISETEVKRIVASQRAKGLTEILRFEERTLEGEEAKNFYRRQAQMHSLFNKEIEPGTCCTLPARYTVLAAYYAPPIIYPHAYRPKRAE